MSYKLFIVESNKTLLYFYGVTRKNLYKKMNMLRRNHRVRNEGRLGHSPHLCIFPDVSITLVETHDTREDANKRIEQLRQLDPQGCLNKPSTIYGDLKEYKKKENEKRKAQPKIYCEYCCKYYSKDYYEDHLTTMFHEKNMKEKVGV